MTNVYPTESKRRRLYRADLPRNRNATSQIMIVQQSAEDSPGPELKKKKGGKTAQWIVWWRLGRDAGFWLGEKGPE